MAPRKRNYVTIASCISVEQEQDLREAEKLTGLNKSEIIRSLLDNGLVSLIKNHKKG